MATSEGKFVTEADDLLVFFEGEWLAPGELEVVDGVVRRKAPKETSE